MAKQDYPIIHPKTRKAWRTWLEKNHDKAQGVWLTYYKKHTGKRHFTYDEAVEEALCFGWIDSLPRKVDDETAMLKFTVRKPTSIWSELNKKRVARLTEEGKMTPAGQEKIDIAKKNGAWDVLNNSDNQTRDNNIPADLQKAFKGNGAALKNFMAFAPTYRKQFLFWIDSAKRPETRTARIKQTVLMAAANKKPGVKGFKL